MTEQGPDDTEAPGGPHDEQTFAASGFATPDPTPRSPSGSHPLFETEVATPAAAGEAPPGAASARTHVDPESTPSPTPLDRDDDEVRLDVAPEPGKVLFDRYLVEGLLGKGGMGSVWRVRHLELQAPRALKLIIPGHTFDREARSRFRREARAMARLSHPNAVTVHDARIARGVAYIDMEHVRGVSLNQVLKPGEPMPLDWVTRVLEQLCDVLQAAHDEKIVHRDLKPSNLMLVAGRPPGKEQIKVLDFGIAKILDPDAADGEEALTRTGFMPFTPQYASPEQIAGSQVGPANDLYSVGVMLYEFLTGRRPFGGANLTSLHLFTAPPTFAEKNPDLPPMPGIERLVLRCLAKTPADRPASARALWEEWVAALPEQADRPRTPGFRWTRRHSALAAGAVALALVPLVALHPPSWSGHRAKATTLSPAFAPADARDRDPERPRVLVRKSNGVRYARIDGGRFVMGLGFGPPGLAPLDDTPAHPVVLSTYYLQETEVSNAEMEAYFRAHKVAPEARPKRWREAYDVLVEEGRDPGPFPAVGVSYETAADFARWVGGRLPTEAQWEYAARSRGQDRLFVWGNDPEPGRKTANINTLGDYIRLTTTPARSYERDRTEQGVYDLTGNAREICRDAYAPYAAPTADLRDPEGPPRPASGSVLPFVTRGGSFATFPDEFRTTGRRPPDLRSMTAEQWAEDRTARDLGFRVVLDWPPKR